MEFTKQELSEEWLSVVEQFPKIFLELSVHVLERYEAYYKHQGIPKDQLVNLRDGFEHGIGWKDIVIGFCQEMQELADEAVAEGNTFQYKGFIFKEKFGQFTPQGDVEKSDGAWEIYRDKYFKISRKWEEKSLTTCEVCGKNGKLTAIGFWSRTICNEHWKN
jgi:hypothetical protein